MKNIVRLVVFLITMMTSTWGATVLQFTGPGFISGGSLYLIQTPSPGISFSTSVTGFIANNILFEFNGFGGSSLYLNSGVNAWWTVGQTYTSNNVSLNLFAPANKSSTSSFSSAEFTVKEVSYLIGNAPDQFAADGVIYDSENKPTWFAIRYNYELALPAVPEPSMPVISMVSLALFLRRRRIK